MRPLMFAFFGHGDVDGNKIGQLIFVKKGDKNGITWPWVSDPRPGWAIKDGLSALTGCLPVRLRKRMGGDGNCIREQHSGPSPPQQLVAWLCNWRANPYRPICG